MRPLTQLEKAFFLKKCPLFAELDLDLVLAIADKVEERVAEKGETIFSINQDAHCLYLIYNGEALVLDEHNKRRALLKAPDCFGDEALLCQDVRRYTTKANVLTHLLTIARSHLIEAILEAPVVALSLLRQYAARTPWRGRGR